MPPPNRTRYRFVGRSGDRYVWQALVPGDSRVNQVECSIKWFWSGGQGGNKARGGRA